MSAPGALVSEVLEQAIGWYRAEGWQSRKQEMELAKREFRRSKDASILPALALEFGWPHAPEAIHRAVLCLVLLRLLKKPSAFPPRKG